MLNKKGDGYNTPSEDNDILYLFRYPNHSNTVYNFSLNKNKRFYPGGLDKDKIQVAEVKVSDLVFKEI